MKQEKKISLDVLYKELRDYCFEVLVDDTISCAGMLAEMRKWFARSSLTSMVYLMQ